MKYLHEELCRLKERVYYLEAILREHGIALDRAVIEPAAQSSQIQPVVITLEHVRFFYSMFKGRRDVYSKRVSKPNPK